MAAKAQELKMENENSALKKLQAAAGLISKPTAERLDWMYEQSATSLQKTDMELMNMPVADQKGRDVEDVKALQESTAGSLFLKSATKTSEDMLRKLREDPLFQIRREEQAARASMMANPLVIARMKKREEKDAKKRLKQMKKAAKKENKKAKKAKKAAKKAKGSSSSSSSSGAASGDGPRPAAGNSADRRAASPPRRAASDPAAKLGPSGSFVGKREQHALDVSRRKEEALASRGMTSRISEEEKDRRYNEMKADAARHEQNKRVRIASADVREKEQEDKEARMRMSSSCQETGADLFKEMRKEAYMGDDKSVADRLKNQRHRRGKNLNDPLEKYG